MKNMVKVLFLLSAFIFSGCSFLAEEDEALVLSQENLLSNTPMNSNQLLLFDNSDSFDSNKWTKVTKGNGTSDASFSWQWHGGDHVYTNEGHLTLKITRSGNRIYCGRIDSKDQFGYGWYEARFKIPPSWKGVQGSFWTKNYGEGGGNNELDIVETYGYNSSYVATVHWGAANGEPGHISTNKKISTPLNEGSYKKWKLDWRSGHLKFYYEDNLQWTYIGAGLPPDAPMTAVLSTEAFKAIKGDVSTATYPMKCFVD